jgi:hypothetical protein
VIFAGAFLVLPIVNAAFFMEPFSFGGFFGAWTEVS